MLSETIKKIHALNLTLLTLEDLRKLRGISSDYTAFKMAERMVKKGILRRLKKGLYAFNFSPPSDFAIANSLYSPSYISFESALSFYGILSQFPHSVTSATTKKTKRFIVEGLSFEYSKVDLKYFFGFERVKDFLIATPEKALLDTLYHVVRGWKILPLDELNLDAIDKERLKEIGGRFNLPSIQRLLGELGLK